MIYHLTTPLASTSLKVFHLNLMDVELMKIALNLPGATTGAASARPEY